MIMLVSGATATVRDYPTVGELILPAAGNSPDSLRLEIGRWAMDNGAYSEFDVASFMAMLQRFTGRKGCLFVSCPDVVGDAHATLEQWPFWSKVIRAAGFRPALVLQDGMLASEIPWRQVGAVFVGGTDAWKFSERARELCAVAKSRGLWVHVGRVNSQGRINQAYSMGADSFDGGQYSMFPAIRIPEGLIDVAMAQARLL